MGCGSSSLKGEKVNDMTGDSQMQPAKKVRTNFSDIDFSSNASTERRGTMAVAPDETRRPTKISEEVPMRPTSSKAKTEAEAERARQGQTGGSTAGPQTSRDDGQNAGASPTSFVQQSLPTQTQSTTTPEIHGDPGSMSDQATNSVTIH